MEWNFDISEAPRGGVVVERRRTVKAEFDVEVFKPARVILATKCGKVVKSQWLPEDASQGRKVARWEMLHVDEQPIAWQPWPEHPEGAQIAHVNTAHQPSSTMNKTAAKAGTDSE